MWIVAVAWVYVVGLLALSQPSVVAGIMTFLGYCVLPLSILFYLTGGKARRARAAAQESRTGTNDTSSDSSSTSSSDSSSSDSSSNDDSSSDSSSSSDD
jgi:hypothetical protein